MSDSAKRGRELFFCREGQLHGLPRRRQPDRREVSQPGRRHGQGEARSRPRRSQQGREGNGAFKTPTIRNVALSAPYMHDGSQKTLEEVVEWYAKGGHPIRT